MQVTVAQARAHVLVKQGLAAPGLASVQDAVAATGGIYGTAPTCYLSCAARIPGFTVADLDTELYGKRSLVRVRAMRGMAYILPLDVLPATFACTGESREQTLKRVAKWSEQTETQVLALADRIEEVMAGRPPLTVPEIRKLLDDIPGNKNALQMTVALLGRYGRIVRTQARGGWRSDLYPYALWHDWLGGGPVEPADPAPARAELARRYLRAYGPAGVDDLKWWTGWTKRDSAAALTALGEEITPVSLDGLESWVLGDEAPTLAEVTPEAGRGVRLLPVWDAYFMGYATSPAGRARQVAEQDYPSVYDKAGNGTSTVIVDGMAAGVWELDADGGRVMVAPFGDDLPWDAVGEQIAALGTAVGAELRLERSDVRGPLSDGPRNTYLSPISLRS